MGDLCSTRSTKLGACIPSVGEASMPCSNSATKTKREKLHTKVIELFFLHTLIGNIEQEIRVLLLITVDHLKFFSL